MADLNLAIVISTTRQHRFGEKPAAWLAKLAEGRAGARYEVVDLRDHPLPFFDEPMSPARKPPEGEEARRWSARMASFDGYVFITGEYNHGIPAVLKNALDYLYAEMNRKPATSISYGGMGGARAIEQLRLNLVELQMAPLRNVVHIGQPDVMPLLMGQKALDDFPHLAQGATRMLEELEWWASALAQARAASTK